MSIDLSDNVMETLDRLSSDLAKRRRAKANRRFRDRLPMQLDCVVCYIGQRTDEIATLPGRTRNISRSGIGLVTRRSFYEDEPIEVRIEPPNRSVMYMAGVVRFCRYILDGFYEIGVQLMVAGNAPVFSQDPVKSIRQIPWLNKAMSRRNERAFSSEAARIFAATAQMRERLIR